MIRKQSGFKKAGEILQDSSSFSITPKESRPNAPEVPTPSDPEFGNAQLTITGQVA